MEIETVEAAARPMLYVTRGSSMDPDEIAGVMGDAFGTLGAFIGKAGIAPAGPPLAVYRDWQSDGMKIDVGFPVAPGDRAKAAGEIMAGDTPAGRALKTVHRGAYAQLRDTYAKLEAHMKEAGIPMPASAWEVYVSDPDTTPEADLLTEIYMPVG